jgi:hypothetical protein
MALKPTAEKMEQAVSGFLRPDEELVTVGWASEKGVRYYYVALTNQRLLIVRLSTFYKVKGEESIPLGELEACSIDDSLKYVPVDMAMISRMAETPLYLKTSDGRKRVFRFANIMGLANKEVPVTIVETLKIGR